jgi:hypothetical protein
MNLKKNKKIKNKFLKIKIFIKLTFLFILFCIQNHSKIYGQPNFSLKIARYIDNDDSRPEVKYEYQKYKNNQMRLIKKEYYYSISPNSKPYKIYEYIYDDNKEENKIISKKETTKNSSCLYKFEYNDKNQLIGIKNSNNQFQVKYNYDDKNRVKYKKKFYFNKNFHNNKYFTKEIYYYEYNEKGQKTKTIYYSFTRKHKIPKINFYFNKSTKINKIISENTYDEIGNKIKKIKKEKANLKHQKSNDNIMDIKDIYTYRYVEDDFPFY